jgi:hypothetical protein
LKLDIDTVTTGYKSIEALNRNFEAVQDAFENTISRDGHSPNFMEAELDMNSHRLTNLDSPQAGSDAVRLIDLQEALTPEGFTVPALSGNTGRFLGTDGDTIFWAAPAPGVVPETFGAVGDGVTNDAAAIMAAAASGFPVYGTPGRTYAVSGNVTLAEGANLNHIHLKQLTPNSATRKTIYALSKSFIRLNDVSVDLNGTGSEGSLNTSAGMWLEDIDRLEMVNCSVTGNSMGAGIKVVNSTGYMDHCRVHDITAGTAAGAEPADDVVNAIYIVGGWMDLVGCVSENIKTRWAAVPAGIHLHTRNFAASGGYDPSVALTHYREMGGTWTGCLARYGDQGFDFSGDAIVHGITLVGCRAENCLKFGFKAAVSTQSVNYIACTAWRCTLTGFVASPPNVTVVHDLPTHDVIYKNCRALETGYYRSNLNSANIDNSVYLGASAYGFKLEGGPGQPYPAWADSSIIYDGCLADGGDSTAMYFGFANQSDAITDDTGPRVRNCIVKNYLDSEFSGFRENHEQLSTTAAVVAANSGWTTVTWTEHNDAAMNVGTVPLASITVPFTDRFRIDLTSEFVTAAMMDGDRGIDVLINGNPQPSARRVSPASVSDSTFIGTTFEVNLEAGDVIVSKVFNNSSSGNINAYPRITLTAIGGAGLLR